MAILDAAASLARLDQASERLRAASSPDDVLDVLAEEARAIAGVTHAWAARVVDGLSVASVRCASGDAAAPDEPAAPPFERLLGGARSVIHAHGFVSAALLGSSGTPEGLLALAASGAEADASLALVLAPLAAVAGFALEAARLRTRIDAVTRAREVLLASVSHDLRNPLNTFVMSAGLLRDDLERNDVDTTRGISLVSRMDRATSRMQGLIEDLIEASRIEARKIDYTVREVPVAQLLKDAATAAMPVAPEKGATVTSETTDNGTHVMADRARALQLIAKIVAFEAKCTGDSGSIRLAAARQGDSVLFTARAFGSGGRPAPPPEEGRGGLALLIARGLLEAQRGTCRVEPGDALVVTFTLPAAKA